MFVGQAETLTGEGTLCRILYVYPNEIGRVEQFGVLVRQGRGPGDMWVFLNDDGKEFAVNPYHYALVDILEVEWKSR